MINIDPQPYSPERIETFLKYLKRYADKGKPFDYKILVNRSEVVHRTDDLDDFMLYEDFMDGGTKWIEVVVYTAQKTCARHVFFLDEAAMEQELNLGKNESLSGIEIEEKIQSAVQNERRKWDEEQERKNILNENAELKEELKEKEKEYEELQADYEALEADLEQIQKSLSPYRGVLGDLGSAVLESTIRKHINTVKAIPVIGESLAGFLTEGETQGNNSGEEKEGEVHVQMTSDGGRENALDDDKVMLYFLSQFKANLSNDQYEQVLLILEKLRVNPALIATLIDLLNEK